MPQNQRTINRAAAVASLYELDLAGELSGLTYRQIAELLPGNHHRSTIMRYLRDVTVVRGLVGEIKTRFLEGRRGI